MSTDDPQQAFLSVTKTAEMFDVTPATIRSWIKSGQLNAIKPNGKNWLISMASIKKMVNDLHGDPLEF